MRIPIICFLLSLLLPSSSQALGEKNLEAQILRVLTPDQAQAFSEGLAPEEIDLANGETLAEYLARQETKGRAGLILRTLEPCLIFDSSRALEKPAPGYPLGLLLRGESRDLSSYGGSAEGCGIPDLVGEIFRSNRARALLLSIEVRDAAEPGSLAFGTAGNVVAFQSGKLTTASSLIVPLCNEESPDPCSEGDLSLLLDGQAEVEITVYGYLEPVGSLAKILAQGPDSENPTEASSSSGKAAGDTPWIEGTGNIHYLNGKVGIGTAFPNSPLVVTGDSTVGGESKAAVTIDAAGNTSSDWALSLRASSGPGEVDDLMVVRGDGRVGLGTKSPITDFHLEGQGYISGDLVLENNSMIRGRRALSSTAAGAAFFNSATPGSSDIDTNPGYQGYLLHNLFWDGAKWVQPRGDMYSQAFTVGHHYDTSWWRAAPSGTNNNQVSLTRSMVIKRNTGNVGIGSASPKSKLVVTFDQAIKGNSDSTVTFDSEKDDETRYALTLRALQDSGDARYLMRVRGDGNVGIGQRHLNEFAKFHVRGPYSDDPQKHIIRVSANGSGNTLGLSVSETNRVPLLQGFRTSDGGRTINMAINPFGGNVGVGTELPTERLEVDGNVKVSGDIQLSGNLVGDGDICIGQCG